MVTEKLHGLQSTSMSINERFTMLANANNNQPVVRERRRPGYINSVDAFLRRLQQTQLLKRRLGVPQGNLRRSGSESNLPWLWRSNSINNLAQYCQRLGVKSRFMWRQPNGTLRRSVSFSNLSGGSQRSWRGNSMRQRSGPNRVLRGKSRGGRQPQGRMMRTTPQSMSRGAARGPQRGQARGRGQFRGQRRGQSQIRGQGQRGRGRGATQLNQNRNNPVPTKQQLDDQLDEYMACSRLALDKQLDEYMHAGELGSNGMEVE